MRIAVTADAHIGNHKVFGRIEEPHNGMNARCRMALRVLNQASAIARRGDCTHHFHLGDLMDTVHPTPQMLKAVLDALSPLPATLLVGNHEQVTSQSDDHALAPLWGHHNLTIVERPTEHGDRNDGLLMVPFMPGPASVWLPRELRKLAHKFDARNTRGKKILMTHVGIAYGDEATFISSGDDVIDGATLARHCADAGISTVLAGNWHTRREWEDKYTGVRLIQVGSLCPTGFDNPGWDGYGILTVLDTTKGIIETVRVPGPRFLTFTGTMTRAEVQQQLQNASHKTNTVFVRWKGCAPDSLADNEHMLRQHDLAHFEIIPDDVDRKIAATGAAFAARSGETFEASLSGYIDAMPLPDEVDRAAVLQRARGYLK